MVADGAYSAQALNQHWGFPIGAALNELFKAAKLGYVEPGVGNFAGIIQVQGDFGVSFDTGDGIDSDWLTDIVSAFMLKVNANSLFGRGSGAFLEDCEAINS